MISLKWQAPGILPGALLLCASLPLLAAEAPPSAGAVLQQNAPRLSLPALPGPALDLPAPAAPEAGDVEPIEVSRIDLQGNTLITTAQLQAVLADLSGKALSLQALEQAAARITKLYQARGYTLAYAYLPAQTIRDGVVTIAVVEPRYDRIEIQGESRLKPVQARRTLGLVAGQTIDDASLQRGLLLLNQTPGLRVQGTLVPGAEPGTSSLQARLSDAALLSGGIGVDNYGSNSTGRIRGTAQAGLSNALGYGEQLSINGLQSEAGLLHSGGGSLTSGYLWGGLRAGVYGSYTDYSLGGKFAALEQQGTAAQWGFNLSWPLLLQPSHLLELRLDVLQNRFTQSSRKVALDDRYQLGVQKLTLSGVLADRFKGYNAMSFSLSHGDKTIDSADTRVADAAGPQTADGFWIAQLQLQRTQVLPLELRLLGSVSTQAASRNLDGSQKMFLGGPQGVMSLAVGEMGGDCGVLSRLQLEHVIPTPLPGALSGAVLLQGGAVKLDRARFPGAARQQWRGAAAAGLELSYRQSSTLSFVFDYAHRLSDTRNNSGENQYSELWAGLQISR